MGKFIGVVVITVGMVWLFGFGGVDMIVGLFN